MSIHDTIAGTVTTLSETFGRKLSVPATTAYLIALEDLTEEQLAAALKRALTECQFMPPPAQLREFAGAGGTGTNDAIARGAALAWEAVLEAMRKHGYTTSVDFGTLVNAVVRNLGGWLYLCDRNTDSLPFVRRDFERVYTLLSRSRATELHGDPLAGQFGGAAVRVAVDGQGTVGRLRIAARGGAGAIDARRVVRALADRTDP